MPLIDHLPEAMPTCQGAIPHSLRQVRQHKGKPPKTRAVPLSARSEDTSQEVSPTVSSNPNIDAYAREHYLPVTRKIPLPATRTIAAGAASALDDAATHL